MQEVFHDRYAPRTGIQRKARRGTRLFRAKPPAKIYEQPDPELDNYAFALHWAHRFRRRAG